MQRVSVDGMTLAYRTAGEPGDAPPVLLVHGWPTSSFLWRRVMGAIGEHRHVLALDLPGAGGSSKPVDVAYDAAMLSGALAGFLDALGIERVGLVVHDLGGMVGMRFALDQPERIASLALLNTLLYPEDVDPQLEKFTVALRTPGKRERFTSDEGLATALRFGTAQEASASAETIAGMTSPFVTDGDRMALAKAGSEFEDEAIADLAARLPGAFDVPVRAIYGEQDRILPRIADTIARVQRDLPQTEVTALPDCGHFLQEDDPATVGRLLAEFFARPGT